MAEKHDKVEGEEDEDEDEEVEGRRADFVKDLGERYAFL